MSAVDTTHRPMHGMSAGWALSAVFAILFLICVAVASFWPTSAFGQGWQTVLATLPGGSLVAVIEFLLGLIAIAWIVAIVFVGFYNRTLSGALNQGDCDSFSASLTSSQFD